MTTQQGLRQASVRAVSGTTLNYEGDWHAMWDLQGIAVGPFNQRMLLYINEKLGTSYTELNGAMAALAASESADNFQALGTFDASTYTFVNAEAEAVVTAFSVQPSAARMELIDTLVGALKTAGVWDLLDLLYISAAHDTQAKNINWKNPATFTLTNVGSGPAFVVDRGVTGSASNALKTGFVPSTNGVNYVLNSASVWAWVLTNVAATVRAVGNDTGNQCHVIPRSATDTLRAALNTSSSTTGPSSITTSIGFSGASRAVSGTVKHWKNGVQVGADEASTSVAVSAVEQYICGSNASGFYTGQVAAAAWGAALTGKEADFYTALLAYMQGVGAA